MFRVSRPKTRTARCCALLIAAAGAGCRSYEPKPLDLDAARDAWLARSPSDETVRQFAERLAQSEGGAPAFDASDGLTLAEAEAVALVFNRGLRTARLEAGVARATAEFAGRWEDPVLGVDIERIVTNVPDPWVLGVTLGLTIPISGRLDAERARAGAAHDAELWRLVSREWATRAALRALWVEWSAEAARAELAGGLAQRLEGIASIAERQEEAGLLSRIEARLFRVRHAEHEIEAADARAGAATLRLRILDTLGLAPSAPIELVPAIAFSGRANSAEGRLAALESGNPELAAARAEYEVAEHDLRVEIRKQYPDVVIGPGYGTDEGDDRVLLGISLPIPLWNRNEQGVAEAEAEREAARARFESAYEQLASRLAIAEGELDAFRAVRETVETDLVPLADLQDAEAQHSAELGRVDPLLLLEAIEARHDAKVRLLEALAAEAVAAIRVEDLLGPPVAVAPVPIDADTSQGASR